MDTTRLSQGGRGQGGTCDECEQRGPAVGAAGADEHGLPGGDRHAHPHLDRQRQQRAPDLGPFGARAAVRDLPSRELLALRARGCRGRSGRTGGPAKLLERKQHGRPLPDQPGHPLRRRGGRAGMDISGCATSSHRQCERRGAAGLLPRGQLQPRLPVRAERGRAVLPARPPHEADAQHARRAGQRHRRRGRSLSRGGKDVSQRRQLSTPTFLRPAPIRKRLPHAEPGGAAGVVRAVAQACLLHHRPPRGRGAAQPARHLLHQQPVAQGRRRGVRRPHAAGRSHPRIGCVGPPHLARPVQPVRARRAHHRRVRG
mmetsp:Transcript_9009/g.29873  ORF Transcript_9009/g.29873 Transcript_9009/m.29873 type:complete len:314 (-) Transcript_9009:1567-2508(-)